MRFYNREKELYTLLGFQKSTLENKQNATT